MNGTTNFQWGKTSFDSAGKLNGSNGTVNANFKGSLQKIGESLDGTVDAIGALMNSVMSDLANDPSSPQLLAKYQQVYAQWTQVQNLQASAVSKASSLNDEILRKA